MNNKLAVSLVLATTTLAGTAFAKGTLPSSDFDPDPKPQIIEDKAVLDTILKTDEGQKMLKILHGDEPRLDEMDPGAQCDDIKAGKEFHWPLYSTSIAGVDMSLGVAGGIGVVADATRMGAEATFGPSLEVFGALAKPIDLKLSASTSSTGQNSVDLKLVAFGYELDSYNIASSTTPLAYENSAGWSLPNAIPGTIGDTYNCASALPVGSVCMASWRTTPLVASIGGVFVLRVNSTGVQVHGIAAANAHSNVTLSGTVGYKGATLTTTGSGVINFIHGLFIAHATLAPHNNRWVAAVDSSISVEDVFGAKVTGKVVLPVLGERTYTPLEHAPAAYHDLFAYQCTFDKDFK